jgi:hypothetical protein
MAFEDAMYTAPLDDDVPLPLMIWTVPPTALVLRVSPATMTTAAPLPESEDPASTLIAPATPLTA